LSAGSKVSGNGEERKNVTAISREILPAYECSAQNLAPTSFVLIERLMRATILMIPEMYWFKGKEKR
jgi:hypothetical protein